MIKKIILIQIFLLAFILRFWQLGNNPPSLDWDEASLGYNAYSLLKTGKDEYGTFLPLSIRSFGDFKPPLYTYLTVLPVALFGLNEFSTRFISAILGTLSIIVGYLLIKELFPHKSYLFFALCSLLFAISPWHIQFSRVAFEANTALFFFIAGFWLFLKGIRQGKFFLLSSIFFAISFYGYHSPRLVIPILLLGLIFIYRRELRRQFIWFAGSILIFIFLVLPIIQQFRSSTAARFGSVTVINSSERLGESIKSIEYDQKQNDVFGILVHNRRIVFARDILAGYLDHFNFDFLFLNGDPPGRHHAVGMGMLYLWDLPFVLLGFFYLLKERNRSSYSVFWWFLVAPLASALTTGTPHAVRALLYLPTYQIFSALGMMEFIRYLRNSIVILSETKNLLSNQNSNGILRRLPEDGLLRMTLCVTFLLLLSNFFYYLHMYWRHSPFEYSQWWQYGYKQVVEKVAKLEQSFDKVIVTYRYDQPYIFFLFYNKIDPFWYQQNWGEGEIKRSERMFGKYEFRNIDWEKDSKLNNVLLVGTPNEITEDAGGVIDKVHFLDRSVAFRIATR